ncbi:MAG: nucleoside triphosphate pyrophosphohydrolase [Candidatus Saccharibacteria bacterium]
MNFTHTYSKLPSENIYPKLIRDKIPAIIKAADGLEVPVRLLVSDDEYLSYLLKKVVEEANELAESKTDSNLVEEISDVYEVIDTLLSLKGISRDKVLAVQDEKKEKRGGFERRLLMLDTH